VKKLLIIEDEKALVEEWTRRLENEGFNVQYMTEAIDVLKAIDVLDCDLIVLDVMMPINKVKDELLNSDELPSARETGVWLCKKIREKYPHVPIVGVTVVGDPEIFKRLREAGVSSIVSKPVTLDDLIKIINKFVK
jgi:two-component system, OmpR family, response regulator MprA